MIKAVMSTVCSLAIACAFSGVAVAGTAAATTHVVPDTDNTGVIPPRPPISNPTLTSPARTAVVPDTTNTGAIPPTPPASNPTLTSPARLAVVPDSTNDGTIPPVRPNFSAG